jgi:hypothetical protein
MLFVIPTFIFVSLTTPLTQNVGALVDKNLVQCIKIDIFAYIAIDASGDYWSMEFASAFSSQPSFIINITQTLNQTNKE